MNACWKASFGLLGIFFGIGGARTAESFSSACIFVLLFIVPGIFSLLHVSKQHKTDINPHFPFATGTLLLVCSFMMSVAAFTNSPDSSRMSNLLDALIYAAIGAFLVILSLRLKDGCQTADAFKLQSLANFFSGMNSNGLKKFSKMLNQLERPSAASQAQSGTQSLADLFSNMNSDGAENFSKMLNQMGSGQSSFSKPEEQRSSAAPEAASATSSFKQVQGILVFTRQPLGKNFEKLQQKIIDQQLKKGYSIASNLISGEEAVNDLNDKEFIHERIRKKFSSSCDMDFMKNVKSFSFRASNGSLGKYCLLLKETEEIQTDSKEKKLEENLFEQQANQILSYSNVELLLNYGLVRTSSSSKYLMTKDGILYVDGMLCSKRYFTNHSNPSSDLMLVSRGRMILLKCRHLTALSHVYLGKYSKFIVDQSMIEGSFDLAEVALHSLAGCFSHVSRHYIEDGSISNAIELFEKHRKGWAMSNSKEAKFIDKILCSWPDSIEDSLLELHAIHSSHD